MKKKTRTFFIWLLILLVIGSIALLNYMGSRTIYNDGYVVGNTTGNLYNGGLFCESNGQIFFSNPKDGHKLYVMDSDGSNVKKLCDDVASYINADENYVYYVRNNGSNDVSLSFLQIATNSLCRITRDEKKVTILDDAPCLYASLVGNYVYYIHYDDKEASTLYRVRIDGSEREQISKVPYKTCAVDNGFVYFNEEEYNHNLMAMDTTSNNISTLYECVCYEPTVMDGIAYYMDGERDYGITRVDLSYATPATVVPDRVDCYNIYEDGIFYQKNAGDASGIYHCNLDGSNEELIMEGTFTSIHTTSNMLYFYDFNNDSICYQMPMEGGSVTPFAVDE